MSSTSSNFSYNSQRVCNPSINNHGWNKGKDEKRKLEEVKEVRTRERALQFFDPKAKVSTQSWQCFFLLMNDISQSIVVKNLLSDNNSKTMAMMICISDNALVLSQIRVWFKTVFTMSLNNAVLISHGVFDEIHVFLTELLSGLCTLILQCLG